MYFSILILNNILFSFYKVCASNSMDVCEMCFVFYAIGRGQTAVNKIKQEKVLVYTYRGGRQLKFFSGRGRQAIN